MKIKEKPEDFYVKEIIDLNKKEPGETFKYFILWKRNLTTIRAIKIISKKLKISKRRINFAGEKDKKAITEQYISIRGLKNFKEEYNFGNVKLKYVGSFSEPIKISDIIGNYFKIKIKINLNEKEKFLKNIEVYSEGFVNYFDEQRFGDIRCNNHLIGKEILKRNWKEACRILLTFTSNLENPKATEAREWLKNNWGNWKEAIKKFPRWLDIELAILNYLVRKPEDYFGALKKLHRRLLKLFVHSYQSYLWNIMVSEYIKGLTYDYKVLKEKFGELIIPKKLETIKKLKNKVFPIIGYDIDLNKYPEFKDLIKKILKKENIKLEDFFFVELPSLSSEGSERKMIEVPKDLDYDIKDNEIILEFILNRGSYATMFIKHLFL